VYKKKYFNINYLDHCLLGVYVFLLQDFNDIFLDDIPSRLPPIRETEDRIDPAPIASIPNWLAYRSNLEETRELQRQVKELMIKWYIRESISPCVVSLLLIPKKDGI
jgi:hypothetical protein